MRCVAALLLVLGSVSASAQTPAVVPGDAVRITLAPPTGAPLGARTLLVGRVAQVGPDSLGLDRIEGVSGMERLAWADVAGVERRAENRSREGLGLLVGALVGGLAGYAVGPTLTGGDSLGHVLALPGGLGGLLVGGIIGARSGERWQRVPEPR
jgi:hypothetical protein